MVLVRGGAGDEGPVALGHTDLQDVHDVRVTGKLLHRETLTQKAFPLGPVQIRCQHLDGDGSPVRGLVTAVDHARLRGRPQIPAEANSAAIPVRTGFGSPSVRSPDISCPLDLRSEDWFSS